MLVVIASVPRPTSTPRFISSMTFATPTALFMFDCGLWTTAVLVSASKSISWRLTWMQCAAMERGPRISNLLQALDHAFAMVPQRPILIALGLGDVDVKAGAQFVAEGCGLFHRGIRERERRVQAEERFHAGVILPLALADE